MNQEKEDNTSASLDQAFEWRTTFNELKSIQPLMKAIELECSETAMHLETYLASLMSRLPSAKQQRIKELAYVSAGIQPLNMTQLTFDQTKQELKFRSQSAQDLYNTVSHETHDPLLKFKWLLIAAEKGCAEAQAFVGWCYKKPSCGCLQDWVQSLYWYTKAAKQNNLEAQHMLETFFVINDVPKTKDEANARFCNTLKNYTKQDNKEELAQLEFTLGTCYHRGYGVELNLTQAIHFYRLAAYKNHADAQITLAPMYIRKNDDPESIKISLTWLETLAKKGNDKAQYQLARYLFEDGKSRTEGTKWCTLAAKQNNSHAIHFLARIHKENEEYKEAYDLFLKSAQQGLLVSGFVIGRNVAEKKENIWTDICSAQDQLEWLTWSSERGETDSQVVIGLYMEDQKQFNQALEMYTKAANRGNPHAYNCLAICYVEGMCVKKNMTRAIELFTLGANLGDVSSQHSLGVRYYGENLGDANISIIDKNQGLIWIRKAANSGYKRSEKWLVDKGLSK